ncbi:MAG: mechanosensitive ion channel family protein [Nevskia sp.]|nr:mechanosensitive ion channel family protein [Nevskia sp.]
MKQLLQLDRMLLQNSLHDWLIAVGIVLGIMLVAVVVKRQVIQRLSVVVRRTSSGPYESLVKMAQATRLWLLLIVALKLGSDYLELTHKAVEWLDRAATVAVFLQLGIWLSALLDAWITRSRNQALENNVAAATSLAPFSFLGRLLLWLVMVLLALDNVGVNISAMVTSLGVGGIAVALAVQNILGDLFASLSIVIDKPFVIGDAIGVDGLGGTVEHVGLKTTRIRSNTGEQIVFSNSDLLKARLRNYKRMQQRCVTFGFGVPYRTTPEQLEKVPALARAAIEGRDKLRFDRAHFKDLGSYAYLFEVVYWVLEPDYMLYMDSQQAINLALLRALANEGIALATPVQALAVDGPVSVRSVVQEARA